MNRKLPLPRLNPIVRAALALCLPGTALASPTGGVVTGGQASISTPTVGTTMIDQGSHAASIDWQSFSIGREEYVLFNQPTASSLILNRVIGGSPSEILGQLSANGRVFLVNPAGVVFGAGSQVDVGGLVATTLDIDSASFLAGQYVLAGDSDAAVHNAGRITAADGGAVVLAGAQVGNSGLIQARLGDVVLASGSALTLDFDGSGLIHTQVDAATLAAVAGVSNVGQILAQGGQVLMSARLAHQLAGSAVNNSGLIRADGISEAGGEISLIASGGRITQGGTLDVSSATAAAGQVQIHSDQDITLASGSRIQATGTSGGDVRAIASGTLDYQQGAAIDVARQSATGEGGFVELSGHERVRIRDVVGLGEYGTLLIDPVDVVVGGTGPDDISEATLEQQLSTSSSTATVQVVASNTITFADSADGAFDGRGASAGLGANLLVGIGTVTNGNYTRGAAGSISFADASNSLLTSGNVTVQSGSGSGSIGFGNIETLGNITFNSAGAITAGDLIVGGVSDITLSSNSGDITTGALVADRLALTASNGRVIGGAVFAGYGGVSVNSSNTNAADDAGGGPVSGIRFDLLQAQSAVDLRTFDNNPAIALGEGISTGDLTAWDSLFLSASSGNLVLGNVQNVSAVTGVTFNSLNANRGSITTGSLDINGGNDAASLSLNASTGVLIGGTLDVSGVNAAGAASISSSTGDIVISGDARVDSSFQVNASAGAFAVNGGNVVAGTSVNLNAGQGDLSLTSLAAGTSVNVSTGNGRIVIGSVSSGVAGLALSSSNNLADDAGGGPTSGIQLTTVTSPGGVDLRTSDFGTGTSAGTGISTGALTVTDTLFVSAASGNVVLGDVQVSDRAAGSFTSIGASRGSVQTGLISVDGGNDGASLSVGAASGILVTGGIGISGLGEAGSLSLNSSSGDIRVMDDIATDGSIGITASGGGLILDTGFLAAGTVLGLNIAQGDVVLSSASSGANSNVSISTSNGRIVIDTLAGGTGGIALTSSNNVADDAGGGPTSGIALTTVINNGGAIDLRTSDFGTGTSAGTGISTGDLTAFDSLFVSAASGNVQLGAVQNQDRVTNSSFSSLNANRGSLILGSLDIDGGGDGASLSLNSASGISIAGTLDVAGANNTGSATLSAGTGNIVLGGNVTTGAAFSANTAAGTVLSGSNLFSVGGVLTIVAGQGDLNLASTQSVGLSLITSNGRITGTTFDAGSGNIGLSSSNNAADDAGGGPTSGIAVNSLLTTAGAVDLRISDSNAALSNGTGLQTGDLTAYDSLFISVSSGDVVLGQVQNLDRLVSNSFTSLNVSRGSFTSGAITIAAGADAANLSITTGTGATIGGAIQLSSTAGTGSASLSIGDDLFIGGNLVALSGVSAASDRFTTSGTLVDGGTGAATLSSRIGDLNLGAVSGSSVNISTSDGQIILDTVTAGIGGVALNSFNNSAADDAQQGGLRSGIAVTSVSSTGSVDIRTNDTTNASGLGITLGSLIAGDSVVLSAGATGNIDTGAVTVNNRIGGGFISIGANTGRVDLASLAITDAVADGNNSSVSISGRNGIGIGGGQGGGLSLVDDGAASVTLNSSQGDITIEGTVAVDGSFNASGGSLDLGGVDAATGSISLNARNNLLLQNNALTAGGSINVDVGTGDLQLVTATAGLDLTLNARNGQIVLDSAGAVRNVSLSSFNTSAADDAQQGGLVSGVRINGALSTQGSIDIRTSDVTGGQGLGIVTGDLTAVDNLVVLTSNSGDITLGDVQVNNGLAGGSITVSAGAGRLDTGAFRVVDAGSTGFGPSASLNGRDGISIGGDLGISDNDGQGGLSLSSSGGDVLVSGRIAPSGSLSVTAGNLSFAGIDATTGALSLSARGSLSLADNRLAAGTSLGLDISQGDVLLAQTSSGLDTTITARNGRIDLDALTVGRNLVLNSSNTDAGDDAQAGGRVSGIRLGDAQATVTVGGSVDLRTSDVTGGQGQGIVTSNLGAIDTLVVITSNSGDIDLGSVTVDDGAAGTFIVIGANAGRVDTQAVTFIDAGGAPTTGPSASLSARDGITVDGDLLLVDDSGAGSLSLSSSQGDVRVNGRVAAQGTLSVNAGAVDFSGIDALTGSLSLFARDTLTLADTNLTSGSSTNIDVSQGDLAFDSIDSGLDLTLTARNGRVLLDGASVARTLSINSSNTDASDDALPGGRISGIVIGSALVAGGGIDLRTSDVTGGLGQGITTGDLTAVDSLVLLTSNSGNIAAGDLTVNNGAAGSSVTLSSASGRVDSGALTVTDAGSTGFGPSVSVAGGAGISIGGDLRLVDDDGFGSLSLSSGFGDISVAGRVSAPNSVSVSGGNLSFAGIDAVSSFLVLNARGTLDLADNNLSSGSTFSIDVGQGDVDLGSVQGGLDVSLTARNGQVVVDSVDAGRNFNVNSANTDASDDALAGGRTSGILIAGAIDVAGSIDLRTSDVTGGIGQGIRTGDIDVADTLVVITSNSGNIDLGAVTVNDLNAGTFIVLNSGGGRLDLDAFSVTDTGSVGFGPSLGLSARDGINIAGDVSVIDDDGFGDLFLSSSQGDISIGGATQTTRNFNASAGGDIRLGGIDSGGSTTLSAGGTSTVTQASGDLLIENLTGGADLSTGDGQVEVVNLFLNGGDLRISSTNADVEDDTNGGRVSGIRIGDQSTSGSITLETVDLDPGNTGLRGGSLGINTGNLSAGGDLSVTSDGGALNLEQVSAGGNLTLVTLDSLNLLNDTLTAGGAITVGLGVGDLSFTTVSGNGVSLATADGAVSVGDVDAGSGALIVSSTNASSVDDADGRVSGISLGTVTAGGDISLRTIEPLLTGLDGPQGLGISTGAITGGGSLTAAAASGDLSLGAIDVQGDLSLAASAGRVVLPGVSNLSANGSVSVLAGVGDLDFSSVSGQGVSLTARNGQVLVDTMDAGTGGATVVSIDANVADGGAGSGITVGSLIAAGPVSLSTLDQDPTASGAAGVSAGIFANSISGGAVSLNTAGAIFSSSLNASGAVVMNGGSISGGSLTADSLAAGAPGDITFDSVELTGNLTGSSASSIAIGGLRLTGGSGVVDLSAGSVDVRFVEDSQLASLRLQAARGITVSGLADSGQASLTLASVDISGAQIDASDVAFNATGPVVIASLGADSPPGTAATRLDNVGATGSSVDLASVDSSLVIADSAFEGSTVSARGIDGVRASNTRFDGAVTLASTGGSVRLDGVSTNADTGTGSLTVSARDAVDVLGGSLLNGRTTSLLSTGTAAVTVSNSAVAANGTLTMGRNGGGALQLVNANVSGDSVNLAGASIRVQGGSLSADGEFDRIALNAAGLIETLDAQVSADDITLVSSAGSVNLTRGSLDGDLTVSAVQAINVLGTRLSGATGSLDAVGNIVLGASGTQRARIDYSQAFSAVSSDGGVTVQAADIGPATDLAPAQGQVQPRAAVPANAGSVLLDAADTLLLADTTVQGSSLDLGGASVALRGAQLGGGATRIVARSGTVDDGGQASGIDAAGLFVSSPQSILLGASNLEVGTGTTSFAGDSELLAALVALGRAPAATAPNAAFVTEQAIEIGTLNLLGDYLLLNADAVSFSSGGLVLQDGALLQFVPGTESARISVENLRDASLGQIAFGAQDDFPNPGAGTNTVVLGSSSYQGDIVVGENGTVTPLNGTDLILITDGTIFNPVRIQSNGAVTPIGNVVNEPTNPPPPPPPPPEPVQVVQEEVEAVQSEIVTAPPAAPPRFTPPPAENELIELETADAGPVLVCQ